MKILLAGPGTGKTTSIKKIINDQFRNAAAIRVVSFTNATVNDLQESFKDSKNISCSTLHSLALQLNHLQEVQIISRDEEKVLVQLSTKLNIGYEVVRGLLNCITFDAMIEGCAAFIKANPV